MQKRQVAQLQPGYNIQQRIRHDEKYRNYSEYAKKYCLFGST